MSNTETLERPTRVETDFAERVTHQSPAVRDDSPPVRHGVELPKTGYAKVIAAVASVMAEIKPVEKLGWNKFQNYAHARIGDLNAELTPLMGKHGVVVFQNEVDRQMFDGGKVVSVRYEFTVVHSSGEIWPERPLLTGMASCRNSKDGFDDKTFNKCHTAARKYFLISLFQIPVEDASDADEHGEPGASPSAPPRPTRRAPSPDGKATPNVLPIIDGEHPDAWAARFKTCCADATSPAVIQKWYAANLTAFEKLKRADVEVYNGLIDFMDKLEAKLAGGGKKADPITSGPQEETVEDKPKPAPRQRRAPAPAPEPEPEDGADATDETKLWLDSLENAFGACEDASSLAEQQNRLMTPKQGEVSQEAWKDALKLVRTHLARVSPP